MLYAYDHWLEALAQPQTSQDAIGRGITLPRSGGFCRPTRSAIPPKPTSTPNVGNDPTNMTDPSGLTGTNSTQGGCDPENGACETVVVIGYRTKPEHPEIKPGTRSPSPINDKIMSFTKCDTNEAKPWWETKKGNVLRRRSPEVLPQ